MKVKPCTGVSVIISCLLLYALVTNFSFNLANPIVDNVCNVSSDLKEEISRYSTIVSKIIRTTTSDNGNFKGKTWNELAYFVDKFGNRISGSQNLENAINYMINILQQFDLENVHGENVSAPNWIRGKESAFLTSPRVQQLSILGLGYSVGTPKEGIKADVLVVQSFEELYLRASEAKNKIVVIAEDWLGSYGATVKYRSRAAVEVAKVGGVAALIRSITQFSINSPHTGMMSYEEGVNKIPVAALSVENAEMLLRISKRDSEVLEYENEELVKRNGILKERNQDLQNESDELEYEMDKLTELNYRLKKAKNKIVVIAEDWLGSYGATVKYRSRAAVEVAKVGGVAALIRSITQFSINSPHTGMMSYEEGVNKIPVAALSVENAEMLLRISKRGVPLKMVLFMDAKMGPNTVSRNTVAELRGTKEPEKVVVVSGHLDSWDVGQGAMDDGGGAFISWGALALLRSLGLRPKRTIRAVLWTAEEMGLIGAQAYSEAHINETDNFIAMMESDEGTFTPLGLEYAGSDEGGCIIKEILKLMAPLNATHFKNSSEVGSDITLWKNRVPLLSNLNDNGRYFWFHHSEGDTMTVINPDDLDKNIALWAATAYILADLSIDLPKPNPSPTIV